MLLRMLKSCQVNSSFPFKILVFNNSFLVVWKRLNDHGKNWRHVYKSLVLLDHLIKYGNERVSQQCKENIFAIQTLKDFQYIEDQKDQGYNVREKAKQLVALLKDDERLRNERRKAQDARERYSRQAMGIDSAGGVQYGRVASATSIRRNSAEGGDNFNGTSYPFTTNPPAHRSSSFNENLHQATTKDFVQPTNQEEEQLQMQIALAESQREVSLDKKTTKLIILYFF
jgi:epsin